MITNSSGQIKGSISKLGYFDPYRVTYHWSIPDEVVINNGDSAPIKLPPNVRIGADTSFNITNDKEIVIGKASFKAGQSQGILTFTILYIIQFMIVLGLYILMCMVLIKIIQVVIPKMDH